MATERVINILAPGIDMKVTIKGKSFSNAFPAALQIAVRQAVTNLLYDVEISQTVESYEED